MKFYNLEMQGTGGIHSISGTVSVTNLFTATLSGECRINSVGGNGVLEMKKDFQWNNSGTTTWGTVKYKFSGSNSQVISGTNVPQFYNMEVNNSGGEVTLSKEVKISNAATFTSGYIVSSSSNPLTFLSGSSSSGASSSSFVKGPVKKFGNVQFAFPIGKGTSYKPLYSVNGVLYQLTGNSSEIGTVTGNISSSPTETIELKARSITLITRPPFDCADNMLFDQQIKVQASTTKICEGQSVTLYLSGGGCNGYYITDDSGNDVISTTENTTVVAPTEETEYHVDALDAEFSGFITIEVSSAPSFTVEILQDFAPYEWCPGDDIHLKLQSATPNLQYNWYPRGDNDLISTISSTVTYLTVYPGQTTTFTINASDGICNCAEQTITIEMTEPANAGDDIWICSDYTGSLAELQLGFETNGTGYHDFVWSPATGLSSASVSNPTFTALPTTTPSFNATQKFPAPC